MILTNRTDYSEPHQREQLAILLSHIVEGSDGRGEVPYKPNDHDDWFWTLDLANNWKVKFFKDQPFHFAIIYRYQCETNQYEQALAAWLAVRISATPVV